MLALVGLGLATVGTLTTRSETAAVATVEAPDTEPALPRGGSPQIGDPVRDLTVWYSDRVNYANRAALEDLRGRFLSPLDPPTDQRRGTCTGR